ncbi:MAG: hypothetical protein CYPHOPRED_003584 [Cyphobasidiales sp. Tagirdzhanova-0007]|nr:MAG: hypothetical protein CYPHOPRED_003584 [Cyphobasidiales sp. Tagirdzhanova-0007]
MKRLFVEDSRGPVSKRQASNNPRKSSDNESPSNPHAQGSHQVPSNASNTSASKRPATPSSGPRQPGNVGRGSQHATSAATPGDNKQTSTNLPQRGRHPDNHNPLISNSRSKSDRRGKQREDDVPEDAFTNIPKDMQVYFAKGKEVQCATVTFIALKKKASDFRISIPSSDVVIKKALSGCYVEVKWAC